MATTGGKVATPRTYLCLYIAGMTPLTFLRSVSGSLGTAMNKAWACNQCARRRPRNRGSWLWACFVKDPNYVDLEEAKLNLEVGSASKLLRDEESLQQIARAEAGEQIIPVVPPTLVESPRRECARKNDSQEVCFTLTPNKPRACPATSVESTLELACSSTRDVSPLTLSPATCSEVLSPSGSLGSPPCNSSNWGTEDNAASGKQALFLSMMDDEHLPTGVANKICSVMTCSRLPSGPNQDREDREFEEEVQAFSRRVAGHQVSWPSLAEIGVEDHLCRAPDIRTFEFFDRRDRSFRVLAETPSTFVVDPLPHPYVNGEVLRSVEHITGDIRDRKSEQPSSTVAVLSPGRIGDALIYEEPPDWPRWKIASFAYREAVRYDRRRRRTMQAGG